MAAALLCVVGFSGWLCELGAGSAALADEWVDVRTVGPFRLRSEFPLDRYQALIQELERLPKEVGTALELSIPPHPIEINLFRSKTSFRRYVSARIPGGANRPALFVQGPDLGRIYVYRRAGMETDVRHEATHALLHNALPFVPLWLDEGLAEYFEVPAAERVGKNPHLAKVRWRIRFGWKPRLEGLEALRELSQMNGGDYRHAWAWAHFFLHGPEAAQGVLREYLKAVASGEVPEPLSRTVRRALPQVDRQIASHFRTFAQ